MKTKDLIDAIEAIAPLTTQEEWDNSGFQINIGKKDISRILVALEINEQVVDEAIINKADIIITHHPLIFSPINGVDNNTVIGNIITRLIQNHTSVYSTHTPFDKCTGGNNDYFGKILDLKQIELMAEDASGFCRVGYLSEPKKIGDFINYTAGKLQLNRSLFNFTGTVSAVVEKIGWCTGAGAEFLNCAKEAHCDLFITGDVKYHTAQHAKDIKLNVLDCGHFGTEYIFVENIISKLDKFQDVDIIQSRVNLNPFVLI